MSLPTFQLKLIYNYYLVWFEQGEEDVGDLPVMQLSSGVNQKARISVSAEAFGKYNKKEAFVAKVIAKTP